MVFNAITITIKAKIVNNHVITNKVKIYNVKSQRRQLFKLWLNIMYAKIFAKMSHIRKILSKFLIDVHVQNKMLIHIFSQTKSNEH